MPDSQAKAQAPGRVNLIGEHIDYNGGHVLPVVLDTGVWVVAKSGSNDMHQVTALNFAESCTFGVGGIPDAPPGHWSRYAAGMLCVMEELTGPPPPLDLIIWGNVPPGAGLSSSAALCIAMGLLMDAITNQESDPIAVAKAAQAVEHRYVGVQCGIMDQMASRLGKPDHALLLHCDTLRCRHIPLDSSEVCFVLVDSGVERMLAESEYNLRRQSCAEARKEAQSWRPDLKNLCGLPADEVSRLSTPLLRKRARHVVEEEARVHRAVEALESRNWRALGGELTASHASLRDDYEVSCQELDFLVETALRTPGVYGARMTGGGFGGCTINLVERKAAANFREEVTVAYKSDFGMEPQVYGLGSGLPATILRK